LLFKLLQLFPGIVGAVVIDADDFNLGICLCKGGVDAFFDLGGDVMGGDDEGD